MEYKRLGRTKLTVSEIAYGGLALFYVKLPVPDIMKKIAAALEN